MLGILIDVRIAPSNLDFGSKLGKRMLDSFVSNFENFFAFSIRKLVSGLSHLKSNLIVGVFGLFALTSFSVASAATTFTYTKGADTTFSNGDYISGTMVVDFTTSTPTVTSANIDMRNSSDALIVNFTQANIQFISTIITPVCGLNNRSKYEINFSSGGNTFYINFEPTVLTIPVPGSSGSYSSFNGNTLNNSCAAYLVATSPAKPIPTLGEWAMIFMASLMAMFAIIRMRRSY